MTEKSNERKALEENLNAFDSEPELKEISLNLKDFNLTDEDEHIKISFNADDLKKIADGDTDFLALSGRRC